MNNNLEIFKNSISIDSDMPLYQQLVELIRNCVKNDVFLEGDIIPSEHELCTVLEISRSTVRQAIGLLEEDGLVKRRRGLGTYIAKPKVKRNLSAAYSFTHDMKELGFAPSSRVIDFKVRKVDGDLNKYFKLPDYDLDVYEIIRLRCADNEPLLLETTYIPCYLNRNITKERLKIESLYDILEKESSIIPFKAEETYEAVIIDAKMAKELNCKTGEAGFYIHRFTQDKLGRFYEVTKSITRGSRTKFAVAFDGNSIELNRNYNNK